MLKYVYTLGYLFVIYVHLLFVVGCSNLVVLCDDDNYSDSDSSELNARYFSSRGVLSDLVIHGLLFGNTLIVLIDTSVSVKKIYGWCYYISGLHKGFSLQEVNMSHASGVFSPARLTSIRLRFHRLCESKPSGQS